MLAVVAESSYRCALTAASRFSFSPLEGGIPFSHPSVLNRCLASPVPGRGLRLLPPLPPSLTLPHHHHLLSPGLATTTEPSADERAPITSLLPIMPLFSCNVRPAVCHTNNFHCFRPFVSPPAFFNVRLHHLFAPPPLASHAPPADPSPQPLPLLRSVPLSEHQESPRPLGPRADAITQGTSPFTHTPLSPQNNDAARHGFPPPSPRTDTRPPRPRLRPSPHSEVLAVAACCVRFVPLCAGACVCAPVCG